MAKKKPRLQVYPSPMKVELNWRLLAGNGKIIAEGRGFNAMQGLMKSLNAVEQAFADPDLQIERLKEYYEVG